MTKPRVRVKAPTVRASRNPYVPYWESAWVVRAQNGKEIGMHVKSMSLVDAAKRASFVRDGFLRANI